MEKKTRGTRVPTAVRRSQAAKLLEDSGLLIPTGSIVIPRPSEIIKSLGTTTASLVRPAVGKTPGVHSFGQLVEEFGSGEFESFGNGLVMLPKNNTSENKIDRVVESLNDPAEIHLAIGKLMMKLEQEQPL